MTPDVY